MDGFTPDAVPEEDLDYEEIIRRGGANYGDEDFALCRCPHCGRIYLIEYEVDTLYLDPEDLSRRVSLFDDPPYFDCESCGQRLPEDKPWLGPKAPAEMQVTWDQLTVSPWRWITKRTQAAAAGGKDGFLDAANYVLKKNDALYRRLGKPHSPEET